jgi:ABC-2 type transport system ATP-binding protein
VLAIETEHLTKRYVGRSVVDDVALRVPLGCVYGFLGPNGAGKTTTMRLLLGLLRADAGTIRLVGHDLIRRRRDALAQVGAFVESASLYDHLTGRANLDITRRLLGLPAGEIDRVLEIVEMRDAAPARTGTYSLGMKQRLALARAMLGSPRLLLLDEPTNGLDPDGIVAMRLLIRALPARIGGTVFVSSHLLTEVEHIADHAGMMREGRLVVQDEVRVLLGGGATVTMTVGEAQAGAALLRARGMNADAEGDHTIHLRCQDDALIPQTAMANRILVEADFPVSAIVPHARTLEDVYHTILAPAFSGERLAA